MATKTAPAPATAGVLKYGTFQFFWTEGADYTLPEFPEGSVLEVHPTFINVDSKEGWGMIVPLERIRFINVSNQL